MSDGHIEMVPARELLAALGTETLPTIAVAHGAGGRSQTKTYAALWRLERAGLVERVQRHPALWRRKWA